MGLDLVQECQRSLALVQEDVEDGILYMDAGAGEAFHFNGGLPSVLGLGARAICSLEHASPFDAAVSWRGTDVLPIERIVILTSRLLTESHQDVIRCLRMHPSVRYCTIWTSISEEAHSAHPDTNFGLGAFHDYKNSLLRDLGNSFHQHYVSSGRLNPEPQNAQQRWEAPEMEVKHFPMMVCSFSKSMFVLPSRGSVAEAPLSDRRDVRAISRGIPGIDITSQATGEEHIPAGATLLAHCLQHVAAQMDLKCEIFTLGPLSHAVGKIMAGLPVPPEGTGHPRRAAGLVLVDRTLDLVTPTCHGDSLLDRIYSSLPRQTVTPSTSTTGFTSPRPPPPRQPVLPSTIDRSPMDLRLPFSAAEEKTGAPDPCRLPLFPVDRTTVDAVDKSRSTSTRRKGSDPPAEPIGSKAFNSSAEISLEREDLLAGSLSTSWDRKGFEYFETLLTKRTKDSLPLVKKWLQEALRQEKLNVPAKGRLGAVTINELRSMRRLLADRPETAVRHMALIQVVRAVELALDGRPSSHWDAFGGAEKILMLSAGDSSQSLALQLQDIVQQYAQSIRKSSASGNDSAAVSAELLSLRDALTLAIVGYGLAGEDTQHVEGGQGGPFAWEEEQALKEAVVEAILEGSPGTSLGFLQSLESALATFLQRKDPKSRPSPSPSPSPRPFPRPSDKSHNKRKTRLATRDNDEWDPWNDDGFDPADEHYGENEEEEEEEDETEEYSEVQLKLELRDRLGEVFGALHKVADASSLNTLQDVLLPIESQISAGGQRTGLIFKLLSLIFAKQDIPGLEHHVSGMGRFLRGGLGRFGLRQAKPKVSDQKVLLVFVIGGLNFVEVREAKEAQAAIPGGQSVDLLLGGTTLLTPRNMYDMLLGSCGSV